MISFNTKSNRILVTLKTTNFKAIKMSKMCEKAKLQNEGQSIMSLITCLSRECAVKGTTRLFVLLEKKNIIKDDPLCEDFPYFHCLVKSIYVTTTWKITFALQKSHINLTSISAVKFHLKSKWFQLFFCFSIFIPSGLLMWTKEM